MGFRQYRSIDEGEFFVVGVDTSAGGLDYCAAQFLSVDNLDVPLVYHDASLATEMTPVIFNALEKIFDITRIPPVAAFERNNGGLFEMERLASLNRDSKFKVYQTRPAGNVNNEAPKMLGWNTTSASRPKMQADLKQAIDQKLLRIYDKETIEELFAFIIVQTSSAWKATAEQGAHDDLIMSLAISWQLQQTETRPSRSINKMIVNRNVNRKKTWIIG